MSILTTSEAKKLIFLIIIFAILWQLYERFGKEKYGYLFNKKLVDVPRDIKCAVEYDKCEEGDLTSWSFAEFAIALLFGLAVPGRYIMALILIVLFEAGKMSAGYDSHLLIDPLVLITGYSIGSLIR